MEIRQMDQSQWGCYEFEKGGIYYGEVAYVAENGTLHPKDSAEVAKDPKSKLIRHGYGINIYDQLNGKDKQLKYQGNWKNDRKQGKGKLHLKDGSVFEGRFNENEFEIGKMVFANSSTYEGDWRKNKMEGVGTFKHHSGFTLKGQFKMNFYLQGASLRNPHMSEEQYNLSEREKKEIAKQKEKNQKAKHGFTKKIDCNDKAQILQTLEKATQNNRIPLLLASEQSKFSLDTLLSEVLSERKKCNVFDLRKAYSLEGQEQQMYKQHFKAISRYLLDGEDLVINLDDSAVRFEEMFYPDLKQFYSADGFNSEFFNRDGLINYVGPHLLGEGNKVNEDYLLLFWSRMKLPQETPQEKIGRIIESQLGTILPMIKIDIVYLNGVPEVKEIMGEAKPQEATE